MKLRSYLRGLGIGIIVTALLMGMSTKEAEMSDAEIMARAKKLGMVEGSVTLAEEAEKQLEQLEQNKEAEDSTEEQKDAVKDEVSQNDEEENVEGNMDGVTQNPLEDSTEQSDEESGKSALDEKLEEDLLGIRETGDEEEVLVEEENGEEAQQEEPSEGETLEDEQPGETAPEAGASYTLEIRGGDTSVSVSRKLVELGLVEDASEYDQFLCRNGYDKKICTGTYEIGSDATYEDIAKIITKSN